MHHCRVPAEQLVGRRFRAAKAGPQVASASLSMAMAGLMNLRGDYMMLLYCTDIHELSAGPESVIIRADGRRLGGYRANDTIRMSKS